MRWCGKKFNYQDGRLHISNWSEEGIQNEKNKDDDWWN
jgi:hypothetical protein